MRVILSRRHIPLLIFVIAFLGGLLPGSLGAVQARSKVLPRRVGAAIIVKATLSPADTSGGGTVTAVGTILFPRVNGRCAGSFILITPIIPYFNDDLEAIVPCPIGLNAAQQRNSLVAGDILSVSVSSTGLVAITVTGPANGPVPNPWYPPLVLRLQHSPRVLRWRMYGFSGTLTGLTRNGLYEQV